MLSTLHRTIIALAAIVWIGLLINLVAPFPAPWNKVLFYFLIGMAILRALELVMYRALLGVSDNTKAVDAVLIVLIGSFHASWLAKQRANQRKDPAA